MNRREFLIGTAIASATVAVPFVPSIADVPKEALVTVSIDKMTDGRSWITVRGPDKDLILFAPYHAAEHKHIVDSWMRYSWVTAA
ncbi:hypothetical protein [Denitrobaculum tricleocarpae]|uniref:Twin-arginine translocation signal domain-containing protein n=1 Tax=Denitrobaculum tricleocarpae TaxID=2591009 RepID=A0A545TSY7_9PROT|nr:hypothetical protein [Denitrobaculum tricleocarpae]TQV80327.1 hypothetical protein FKG95_09030 [Denitrobaculum tricleocarpae]